MKSSDPQRVAVYAAEDSLVDEIGPRLRRWGDVERFLDSVLSQPRYLEMFPFAPLDIVLGRRSCRATASVAIAECQTILIRDGSWNALTILHELAHLVANDREPHGADFVATELWLVREFCGFADFGSLQHTFDRNNVARRARPLASGAPHE